MKRYYAVQHCDERQGWQDSGAYSVQAKPCNDLAKELSRVHKRVSRVTRKPHGFVPEQNKVIQ